MLISVQTEEEGSELLLTYPVLEYLMLKYHILCHTLFQVSYDAIPIHISAK